MRKLVAMLSAAVALPCLVAAALAGPRAFEATVAPFDPSPHVMPVDFPRKYIETTPFPDGTLDRRGPGGASRQWYEWLKLWLRPWANARQALDQDAAFFQETVKEDDVKFKAAFAKLNMQKLAIFNSKTKAQQTLQVYVNARGREASQTQAIKGAMSRADAALERVKKDSVLVAVQEDMAKRAAASSDKAAIEKEIAENKAIAEKFSNVVGDAVDLMGSITNPADLAGKSFKIFTSFMLKAAIDEHMMELFVLDQRIDALDKAIQEKQKTAADASLKEARLLVDGATADFVKAILDEQLIIEEQNHAIDLLAGVERGAREAKDANAPEIFQTLKEIHYDIQLSGRNLRKSAARYLRIVNYGPGKRAPAIYPTLDRLITDVRGYSVANKDEWLNVAFDSSKYMTKHAAWYPKEQEFVLGQMSALYKRVDILPMDSYVKQILEKF